MILDITSYIIGYEEEGEVEITGDLTYTDDGNGNITISEGTNNG